MSSNSSLHLNKLTKKKAIQCSRIVGCHFFCKIAILSHLHHVIQVELAEVESHVGVRFHQQLGKDRFFNGILLTF